MPNRIRRDKNESENLYLILSSMANRKADVLCGSVSIISTFFIYPFLLCFIDETESNRGREETGGDRGQVLA